MKIFDFKRNQEEKGARVDFGNLQRVKIGQ